MVTRYLEIGNQWKSVYSTMSEIPVFAKSGAIVPMGPDGNIVGNPNKLTVAIFPGHNNSFDLYEDDGISDKYLEVIVVT